MQHVYNPYKLVRVERLELSRLSTLVPKTSTSTNSATPALKLVEAEGIEPPLPCGTDLQSAQNPYLSTPPNLT